MWDGQPNWLLAYPVETLTFHAELITSLLLHTIVFAHYFLILYSNGLSMTILDLVVFVKLRFVL